MLEKFQLKDGKIVQIKILSIADYNKNDNYAFVHSWLNQINKFLGKDFEKEDFKKDYVELCDFFKNKEDNIMIGAIYRDKIIGTARLTLKCKSKKFKHLANWGIAINPDFQNLGLGSRLIQNVEDISLKKKIFKREADYYEGNIQAEYVYIKKLNYIIEGRLKYGILLNDGKFVDKILIGKIIEKNIKDSWT